jgi:HTH-type transcriptional regulator / antitoxin MqsA
MKDLICYNCGNSEFEHGTIGKISNIKGKLILVENIPAMLCSRCQEPFLNIETTEKVRLLLNSKHKPNKVIQTNVFEFS